MERNFYHLIGNDLFEGEGAALDVFNPTNNEKVATIYEPSKKQIDLALSEAQRGFEFWKKQSLNERKIHVDKLIKVLRQKQNEIAKVGSLESGKSTKEVMGGVNSIISSLEYYFEEAKRLNSEVITDLDNLCKHEIIRNPVGVVVAYLAWNYPLPNLGNKLGPILASGCSCVIKPSELTPLATMLVGEAIIESEFPKGVINIIAASKENAAYLSKSKVPSMITMIGSTKAGKKVIEQSSTSIKRYSMELGGNAPVIVFDDVSVKTTVGKVLGWKFGNCGQVCVSPNRVFVHKKIYNEFISEAVKIASDIILEVDTEKAHMGPMITKASRDRMLDLIADAKEKGAKLEYGGNIPENRTDGNWIFPTVLSDVSNEMRVYKEEIFGPILPIIKFDDKDDMVSLANDTEYGLAAYIYTEDIAKALSISKNIDYGTVCINEPIFRNYLPHGGTKESGIGKDNSRYSLEEYYYLKRVSLKL